MHNHFHRDVSPQEGEGLPSRLYALLDHTEPTTPGEGESALFSFDAVDANRLDALASFGSENIHVCSEAWHNYWSSLSRGEHPANDPFPKLPLYRIDTFLDAAVPAYVLASSTQRPEDRGKSTELHSTWLEVSVLPFGNGLAAEIYPRMFGPPIPAGIQLRVPSTRRGSALDASFSLRSLPHVSSQDVERTIKRSAAALAVYDVGQGSACGLTDDRFVPQMYFDLGCGVYRNAKTAPDALTFCFSDDPPIILSHWDADHWAGAYSRPATTKSALKMHWVVPHQQVSAAHLAFVNDILTAGGTVSIFDPLPRSILRTTLKDGRKLSLIRCDGASRNDSGFALCVSESANSECHWLLTGDAAYDYILQHLGDPDRLCFQAVVVPHHGADLSNQTRVPSPLGAAPQYQRLVFSFGPNNAHGKRSTSHPKASAVDAHRNAGWDVGHWSGVAAPGHRVSKGEVRATGKNGPGCERLHSILINWKGDVIVPQATACGGRTCTHQFRQG